jgi:homoprotocatechuate degradation regulator HpaR
MDAQLKSDEFPPPAASPLPAVSQSLPVRLLRAREAVMFRLRPTLRVYNITEQQWRVLRTIRDLKETEITALAGRVFLLPPSLSRILKDLETRGLIDRRISVNDQRRAIVSLTPQGHAVITEAEPDLLVAVTEMRALFGADRTAQLHRLLAELEAVLGPGDEAGEES